MKTFSDGRRQLTFFEYLFARNIPTFSLSFLSFKRRCRIFSGKEFLRVGEGSALCPWNLPIHPISEKLVSLGMVFTESVLSWTFTCYCLTSFQQFREISLESPIARESAKCKSTALCWVTKWIQKEYDSP